MPFNDDKAKLVNLHNFPGFVRDTDSGVIINTNEADYNIILEKRRHAKEMDGLRDEMQELREMVRKLAK